MLLSHEARHAPPADQAPPRAGVRVLLADDDEHVLALYRELVAQIPGVAAVVAVRDGLEAVETARALAPDVAILDLNMPNLDGVDAALTLRETDPGIAVALQSSDPEALTGRAAGLGFPLFDKLDFDRLAAWVARHPCSGDSGRYE